MASLHQTRKQLRSRVRWGMVGIFILLIATVTYDIPAVVNRGIDAVNGRVSLGLPRLPITSFALGLDLRGGAHLIYEADTSSIDPNERGAAVEGVRDVIERRVNGIGIGEPNVQTSKVGDTYRVLVELPGVSDIKTAIAMIGETPILEFREENKEPPRELTPEEQKQLKTFNADAEKRAREILNRVRNGEDFEVIAKEKSEDAHSQNNGGYLGFIGSQSIVKEIYEWAKTAAPNETSARLIETEEGYNIAKKGQERDGETQVSARHILICYLGARSCDNARFTKEEARAEADRLYQQATADNFTDLAKQYSTEPGAAQTGGDLGTFGRSVMVPEFETAVFGAKTGDIIGPVETPFGFHVIYKTGEAAAKEYELWRILIKKQTAIDILPPQNPWKSTGLSGSQLNRAEVVSDPTTGAVQVSLQFDGEGTELFKDITERNLNKPVAIFLDGVPISIPVVQQAITNGQAVISGNFDLADARLLSQRLNAGALPVPVALVSQQTVGPTLGASFLEASLKAGLIGMIIVMLFMIAYYRLPGLISVIALSFYAALTLAIFKFVGVTLTLAGIAGFILSIGMAVDANVLIFERLKEELRDGKSLRTAIEEGFLRAWLSIRDGNVSTLLTCALLVFFGSSFVKGFALTLAIGICVSIFSAITVTRIMLRFISPWFQERGHWLFVGGIKSKL